jgi:fucose 4-O-acetylase-like acetyltransferase
MTKEWKAINYIDILKGIGILSIVIGHSWYFAGKYVYSYHLALFFFISGFLYNEQKYGNNPFLNLSNRLKNNYCKYLFYSGILGLLHNFLIDVHIYNVSMVYWKFYDFRNYILNSAVFTNSDPLYGATWFVMPLILGSSIFGGIIYIGNIVKEKTKSNLAKNIVIIILGLIICALGYERMYIKFILPFRLDVALFVIPLFLIAYYIKTYIKDYNKYLKWYVAIIFLLLSIFLTYKKGWSISLGSQDIIYYRFYILAIIGIYECMYLANLIYNKLKILACVFSFLGKYTFEIMAFHFLCFKVFDVLYCKATNVTNNTTIETLPLSFEKLWFVYILIGCFIPSVCTSFVKNSFIKLFKLKRTRVIYYL